MAAPKKPTITAPLRIVGHACFEEKDQAGNVVDRSFSVDAAYELGQPAVKLYISPEKAREIKDATGNGFTWDERKGVEFQPYDADGTFGLGTKQNVRRGDKPQKDRVNNQLVVRLKEMTLRAA